MNKILNIKNVSIGYKTKKAQNVVSSGINVSVSNSKLICLLGENGIGKSTLLRSIANVQPILFGSIEINEKNLSEYKALELSKKISVVLTEKIPPNNLTVYELIALGRQTYTNWLGKLTNTDKVKIDEAIKLTNVADLKNKKVDELSDGQYQKVMIARALAQDTPIIILDEPTAHLDINNKVIIFNLLKKLTTKKLIIVTTHELQLAIQNADDLWLMTKNGFIANTKNELIKNNELQSLFDEKLISFDKNTNQFLFH